VYPKRSCLCSSPAPFAPKVPPGGSYTRHGAWRNVSKGYDSPVTSVEAELQELRRRRRTRRIVIAVSCVAVFIVAAVWLSNRNSTMTCGEWQAEYSNAALQSGGTIAWNGRGTVANLKQVRPEGCPIPVPGN
jgi:hypothetical protein